MGQVHQAAEERVTPLLHCPVTQSAISFTEQDGRLVAVSQQQKTAYRVTVSGIPLFAEQGLSTESFIQQQHYDAIAAQYTANLSYPHTRVYSSYLDRQVENLVSTLKGAQSSLGCCLELCCGAGEAMQLFGHDMQLGVGVDISIAMLEQGRAKLADDHLFFMQGDATEVPLKEASFDFVFMFGGIHHVPNRQVLFDEVFRLLKPGGYFVFREPVSDLWLWRCLRAIIYRVSPMLDHDTEKPLMYDETVPVLRRSGFDHLIWKTYGFLGFCFFMNSDVLWFNRFFRFIPGIKGITSLATRMDQWCASRSALSRAGLQVVASVRKPLLKADR